MVLFGELSALGDCRGVGAVAGDDCFEDVACFGDVVGFGDDQDLGCLVGRGSSPRTGRGRWLLVWRG